MDNILIFIDVQNSFIKPKEKDLWPDHCMIENSDEIIWY